MGDDVGIAEAARRSLRAAAQHVPEGQRRAGDLPSDHVLPAQQGQPEHRLPDAELRQLELQGQTISNAFFWAIDRSQDATFLHDWFSKTGQAVAGEYRYVSLGGSGNVRTDFLNEHPITFVGTDGEEVEQAGRRSFRMYGNLSQSLGGSWYAQGRADYSTRPDGRSALRHRYRARVEADAELRRIGQRHDQGHPRHRHLRSQRILRRKLAPRRCAERRRASTSPGPIAFCRDCPSTRR